MSEASVVAIILGLLTFLGGFLTYRAQQRKDALEAAFRLIDELQERMRMMQDDANAEREKRRKAEEKADQKITKLENELAVTRKALNEQTQSRIDRENYIKSLEERLEKVEKKTGPLDPGKVE